MLFPLSFNKDPNFSRSPDSQTSNYRKLNWLRLQLWCSEHPLGLCFKVIFSTRCSQSIAELGKSALPLGDTDSLEVFCWRTPQWPYWTFLRLHCYWGGFHATFFPLSPSLEWDWRCSLPAFIDILCLLSIFFHTCGSHIYSHLGICFLEALDKHRPPKLEIYKYLNI